MFGTIGFATHPSSMCWFLTQAFGGGRFSSFSMSSALSAIFQTVFSIFLQFILLREIAGFFPNFL